MPELPEVETTIRFLMPAIIDQKIKAVWFSSNAASIFNKPIEQVSSLLLGNTIISITRRGKFMLFTFTTGHKAVGHLRMSGRYTVSPEHLVYRHNHFSWELGNGNFVNYIDQRRFGTFHFIDDFTTYPGLIRLGWDALTDEIDPVILFKKLLTKRVTIYQALLDQSIIAGLGNIYVNELLFLQKIHPLSVASSLNFEQAVSLVTGIKPLMQKALSLKGTTLSDNLYQDPEGRNGEFAKLLKVYGRGGQDCSNCRTPIKRLRIGGRGVYVCEQCQKKP